MLNPARLAAILLAALLLAASAPKQDDWSKSDKGTIRGTLTLNGKITKHPVVIYLERKGSKIDFTPPEESVVIQQLGATFKPAFSVAVVGQKVVFDNNETKKIDHNVYTLGAEEKDFGIFARGVKVTHVFEKSGPIRLHCSIHKLMDGKVFVAPTPAYAMVGARKQKFLIRDVPVGKWVLRTFQLRRRYYDAKIEIEVTKDGTTTVPVDLIR